MGDGVLGLGGGRAGVAQMSWRGEQRAQVSSRASWRRGVFSS